jgi:hypothetical protein
MCSGGLRRTDARATTDNPIWDLHLQTHVWGKAATALGGWLWEPRDLKFDTSFENYEYLGEALKAQAADAGTFLLGQQVEFQGNNCDARFSVLMVRLAGEETVKKPRRRRP